MLLLPFDFFESINLVAQEGNQPLLDYTSSSEKTSHIPLYGHDISSQL